MSQVSASLPFGQSGRLDTGLAREEVFDVLSNERRQCVLHYLKRADGRQVDLRELVDYVTAWETDSAIGEVASDERKRVYTALRQSHLPRLEEAGIIEYEHLRGNVRLTDRAEEVQLYLEYVPNRDIPWSEYYLGLAAVGTALVAATWLEVFPFAELSGLVLAALLVGMFLVSAIVHTVQMERRRLGSDKFDLEGR